MDENFQGRANITTTVMIPIWLREEIRQKGYTLPGALVAGWAALQKRDNVDDLMRELRETRDNMERYRRGYIEVVNRLSVLEQK